MQKKLTVKFQKLLGTAIFPAGTFMESLKLERPEGDTFQRRGTLFALLSLNGPRELDAPVFARAIFDTLEEEYFAQASQPPLLALEKAVLSAHRRLQGMTLAAHLGQGVDFHLLLAVLWGPILYLGKLGAGAVYLLRDGKVSEVRLADETLISSASGFVYGGDTLILGSPGFKENFPVARIDGLLGHLESALQEISQKGKLLSAMILKVEVEDFPTQDEVIDFQPAAVPSRRGWPRQTGLRPRLTRLRPRLTRRGASAILVLALLVVFVGAVSWTLKRQSGLKLEQTTRATLAAAELDLVAASDLVGLNDEKAAEGLAKIEVALTELKRLGVRREKLTTLLSQVSHLLQKVGQTQVLEGADLTYDFALLAKDIKPTRLTGTAQGLYLGSRGGEAVYFYPFGLPEKATRVDGGLVKGLKEISADGGRAFFWDDSGLVVWDEKAAQATRLDLKTGDADFFQSYSNNLYFLDLKQNRLWRSRATVSGYGSLTSWLKEPLSLSGAKNFAVGGPIYIWFNDGRLLKFVRGAAVDLRLSGFKKSLSPETEIYAARSLDGFWLTDLDQKLIVAFSPDGVYQKSYAFSQTIGDFDGVHFDGTGQKIYFLSGTKVYAAGL